MERPDVKPRVVEDVIQIARQLGIQYIWVDKYCIDQKDPQKQLDSMYAIYNNAYLTVVDGAGSNMHNGLVGVSTPRTGNQEVIKLAEKSWVSTLSNPTFLFAKSAWNSRGWTYQEAMASPRLLIFTREQVYFECKAMIGWESLHIPLDAYHIKQRSRLKRGLREPVFCLETARPKHYDDRADFPRYITAYTRRTLRNSFDSLNAIKGVLGFLKRYPERSIHTFWGVPLYALVPEDYASALTSGMAWTFLRPQKHPTNKHIRRRRIFPSWSWAGWEGVVGSFELSEWNHYTKPSIGIQVAEESEYSIRWSEFWQSKGSTRGGNRKNLWAHGLDPKTDRNAEYSYPWIEITTGFIRVNLVYLTPSDTEKYGVEHAECDKPGFFIDPPNARSRYTPVAFPEDCPELTAANASYICNRQWDCILLGYTTKGKDNPFVMMLHYSDNRFERVWGGRIPWIDNWEKSCPLEERCVRLY
ncbi:hypothetical protein AWENTII_009234 [Aspergillus wentii]|nr:hypothetical protein MW887_000970 [Aspergillus wentii]